MYVPFADGLLEVLVRHKARRRPIESLESLDLSSVSRVLLVLTTGLGDAVLSTPVFEAVRRALPQARIALFVRHAWAPLFFAESDVDEIVSYYGKWRRFSTTLSRLRAFAPDLAIVLHGNDPDILPLVYLAGSRHIVRVPTAGTRYRHLLSNLGREQDSTTVDGFHYIENRLRVLETVGILPTRSTPIIQLTGRLLDEARTWISRHIGNFPFVVVHRYAADHYKTWPLAQARQFLEAAIRLYPDICFVLTGSPKEQHETKAVAESFSSDRVVCAAGIFDIAGTAGLIAHAKAVVAPDTGLLHLAAALNIPTVGLFSPTQPAFVGPRASTARSIPLTRPVTCTPCTQKSCPHNPALCMAQFSGVDVLSALTDILSSS